MEEFKGTTGVWNRVNHLNEPNDLCVHIQGKTICTMPDNSEESQANAQLIGSAPEMLDALKKCEEFLNNDVMMLIAYNAGNNNLLGIIKGLILKATTV